MSGFFKNLCPLTEAKTVSPIVNAIQLTEHTGTHVDAFNHFGIPFTGKSIDTMPLEMFYTEAICLDTSDKGLLDLIEIDDILKAEKKSGEKISV